MNIVQATSDYEKWLGRHTKLIPAELRRKHELMRDGAFPFLRGTFYRWAQVWPEVCQDFARAPRVLAVGDLHVENFGTWRDIEGRLIWGINDFDEAVVQAYTNDIIRLTASALLAAEDEVMAVRGPAGAEAILEGYLCGLGQGGRPLLLGEKRKWLWQIAHGEARIPAVFWDKLGALARLKAIPHDVRKAIEPLLPGQDIKLHFVHGIAGVGSLGRQRYVAIGDWGGGKVAREAKPMVPSAAAWAGKAKHEPGVLYQRILDRSVRCLDPFVRLEGGWLVRRLSPDCSRIELAQLPIRRDELRLLHCMGWETGGFRGLASMASREPTK